MKRTLMLNLVVFALMAVSLISGCGVSGKSFVKVDQIENNKGLVYLYRPYVYEGLVPMGTANIMGWEKFPISANGKFIGNVLNGGYYYIFLDPGTTVFTMPYGPDIISNTVEIKPRETYYLKCRMVEALVSEWPSIDSVTEAVAMPDIKKCKLIVKD